MTDFLEAGKVPEVRKIAALLRLYGLDGTIVADEELTFAVGLFEQRKPFAIRPHARVTSDELCFAQIEMCGDARNLRVGQSHLTRPPATGRATLALVENWHVNISATKAHQRNAETKRAIAVGLWPAGI